MNMPDTDRYTPPPSWSEVLDAPEPNLFQDQPHPGAKGSTAHRMAERRFQADAEAAREQAQAVLDIASAQSDDEHAYQTYLDLSRSGERVPKSVWRGAVRHARSIGIPVPSSERLAAQAGRGQPWTDQPRPKVGERGYRQDQDRRRGR
jgi:hypothetical protein